MTRILFDHRHIRTTVDSRVACYLMILGYFISDLPVTNDMEQEIYEDTKDKKTGKVSLVRLVKDAKKRGLFAKKYLKASISDISTLFYRLLKDGKLILMGGLSGGEEFGWVINGIDGNGDFYVTDPRIRREDIYPARLVNLLFSRQKGCGCLAISFSNE